MLLGQYQVLLDVVRQQYASVVWTHKIQEKQADIYFKRYNCLETVNIIFASATSCGIVSTIFGGGVMCENHNYVFVLCDAGYYSIL